MNTTERGLMHALFLHLHHNIDKAIDFNAIDALNDQVSKLFPGALVVGPGDDAAVFKFPDRRDICGQNGNPMFSARTQPL